MTNQFRAAVLSGKTPGKPDEMLVAKKTGQATADDLGSVDVERETARRQDHRWNDRHRLQDEKARIRYHGAEHEVELINLSGGGAMIRSDVELRLWDHLDLVFADNEGASIECAVRWIRRDRIGLEFAHETQLQCDDRARDKLLRDVVRRSFPDMVEGAIDRPEPEPLPGLTDEDSQRVARRHPLIWMADVPYDHGIERVRIRNISPSGAMVESGVAFPVGHELMLDLGEAGQHFAKVVWTRGDQTGFAFTHPFDLALLARAKPALAPQRWAPPSYLRYESSKASPWADHWNRRSLADLREELGAYLGR